MISISRFLTILYWVFCGAGLLTLILIVFKSVQNYRRAARGRGVIVAKALVALVAWLVLSIGVVIADTMFAASATHALGGPDLNRPLNLESAVLYVIGANLIWLLAGGVLVYWISRRAGAELMLQ